MSDRLNIAFQGTNSGLVIAIDDELPFQTMMDELAKKLDASGNFFANAEVTLNLGARALTEIELKPVLQSIREKHGLKIVGIKTTSEETIASAELLGLPKPVLIRANRESNENGKLRTRSVDSAARIHSTPTELVRRTLRSGQIFESRKNIVVLGDVNAGAEVISAGDIVVFGALRGVAHAGATGNKEAVIVAWKLKPMQLRIANRIARAHEGQNRSSGPEYACVENDQIVIDKWTNVRDIKNNDNK